MTKDLSKRYYALEGALGRAQLASHTMSDDKPSEQLAEIGRLMRALLAVTLYDMGLTTTKKIELLNQSGLKTSEIASVLNTSSNSVSVTLHKLRTGKAKNAKSPE